MNRIVEYIIPVLREFTSGTSFDSRSYMKNVFSKNADVWGIAMCYDAIMASLSSKERPDPLYLGIRRLFVDTVFQNPERPLDVDEVSNELSALNRLSLGRQLRTLPPQPYTRKTRRRSRKPTLRKRKPTPYPTRHSSSDAMTRRPTPTFPSASTTALPSLYTGQELNNLFSK